MTGTLGGDETLDESERSHDDNDRRLDLVNLDNGMNGLQIIEFNSNEIHTEDKDQLTPDDGILDKSESSGILDDEDGRNPEDEETLIDKNGGPFVPFLDTIHDRSLDSSSF
jgi:hypothetical protein